MALNSSKFQTNGLTLKISQRLVPHYLKLGHPRKMTHSNPTFGHPAIPHDMR